MLFKIELLRVWYGLSDEGVEEMVNDRISFSRFVGLSLAEPAPDSTTVLRFRSAMAEAGTLDQVLREINRQLEAQGLVVKSGAIIDTSVTDSPRRPRGRKEYAAVVDRREEEGAAAAAAAMLREVPRPNVDGEARWIRKAGHLRFGYKRHTVTDPNGMILAEETTAANERGTRHFEGPLRRGGLPRGIPIYADKGYASAENRAAVRRRIGRRFGAWGARTASCVGRPAGRGSRRASSSSTRGLAGRDAGLSARLAPCTDGFTGARRGTWGWPKRMRSTSWRPSPTTCTAPRGSLWPTPKKREESVKRRAKRPAGGRLEGRF